jgi:hypothetical protein
MKLFPSGFNLCLAVIFFLISPTFGETHQPLSDPSEGFALVVLKQDWYDLKLGYTYQQALPLLKKAEPAGSLFILETKDIASYQWVRQMITLTPEATQRLLKVLPAKEDLRPYIRGMANWKDKEGFGNPLEMPLYAKGFLVKVNDQVIYGGIFLDPLSQMAIHYPVIRVGLEKGRAIFSILPIQMPFVTYDPVSDQMADWDAAAAKEASRDWPYVKKDFIRFGNSREAIDFRKVIRNSQAEEVVKKAGKLISIPIPSPVN